MTSIEEIDEYLDNRIRQTRENITLLDIKTHITPM